MAKEDIPTYYPASREEWRQWLQANHVTEPAVWLVQYKKASGMPTISWSEAVDEALCFGWVDSVRKTVDQDKFIQFFSKRKAKSTWSKINKAKIEDLIAKGLMTQAGLDSIALAKQNGSWTILDEVEELTIPADLQKEFEMHPGSLAYYSGLSRSVRKMILQWIALAKRPETRQKRIQEIAVSAAQQLKPNHIV